MKMMFGKMASLMTGVGLPFTSGTPPRLGQPQDRWSQCELFGGLSSCGTSTLMTVKVRPTWPWPQQSSKTR